jgi:hypothetical protein
MDLTRPFDLKLAAAVQIKALQTAGRVPAIGHIVRDQAGQPELSVVQRDPGRAPPPPEPLLHTRPGVEPQQVIAPVVQPDDKHPPPSPVPIHVLRFRPRQVPGS